MKKRYKFGALLSVMLCMALLIGQIPVVGVSAEASIMLLEPADKATDVQVANDLITKFIAEKYTLTACDKYFDLLSDKFAPADITFKWQSAESATALYLAEKADFSDAQMYAVSGNQLVLNGLKSKTTYYWKVATASGESGVFTFTTGNGPRTVSIEGVTNTRDMGGWSVPGGSLKQGVIYRTARLDEITPAGVDYSVNVLGIKTELDLRKPGEGAANVLGDEVEVINISSPYYAGDGSIYKPEHFEAVKQIMQVFADESNYPILFHCTVGRDRTGTIAFLLQALCGMSPADIYREYDLSLFSANGDHAPSMMHKSFFTPTFKKMIAYGDGTLAENTEQYLLDVGLTAAEIQAIKDNLIEYGKEGTVTGGVTGGNGSGGNTGSGSEGGSGSDDGSGSAGGNTDTDNKDDSFLEEEDDGIPTIGENNGNTGGNGSHGFPTSPNTGDSSRLPLALLLVGGAVATMATVAVLRRKQRRI